MIYVAICENAFVVLFFVQTNNSRHTHFLENFNVFARVVAKSLIRVSFFDWAHKSNKPSWDNPMQVVIFNFLVEFILFDIEVSEVIPFEFHSLLKALETLQQGTVV